ncbi:GNAT family N-acetyltransferase [Novilysobacter antarcticus]|uniref:GNAT family N-acetyltransferase n=1 Tax=Novilysobacter antarcticus TaxID=2862543 RepID=UPI001C9A27FB|nr:GNAT family N-acetyltransferase [Lysobacter antarcticus]
MSETASGFHVERIDYESGLPALRAVREAVFVQEQGVPLELEWDELDPASHHVIARDSAGTPIGTARLTPERHIGRMAVLSPWRGRGVGGAMLRTLLARAAELGWSRLSLHAQVHAIPFYARHGFLPTGPRFDEAGIDHQLMSLHLGASNAVGDWTGAIAATLGVIATARRRVLIYSPELDAGVLDAPEVVTALRDFAINKGEIQILLHDPAAPQRDQSPLIVLHQRLPSKIAFRAVEEPFDRSYASAYTCNDVGGYYFRPMASRLEGDTRLDDRSRARHLLNLFSPVWERARPCSEYRALGI